MLLSLTKERIRRGREISFLSILLRPTSGADLRRGVLLGAWRSVGDSSLEDGRGMGDRDGWGQRDCGR